MNPYQIIIVLCGLVILSYVYDLVASWARIPSVLLLMGTGVALRQLTPDPAARFDTITHIVPILGAVGLIRLAAANRERVLKRSGSRKPSSLKTRREPRKATV